VQPLRYAVVGAGMMGTEHAITIAALPDARLVALADPEPRSLAAATRALGPAAPPVWHDAGRMLADAEPDVVVIATPNHVHDESLAPVLRHGAHVLVEKPLAVDAARCAAIRDAVRRTEPRIGRGGPRRVVWVGMEYRYMAATAALIAHVRAGDVGEPRMVSIREHRFPFLHKVGEWNRFSRNTGGTLVEKCCHFFDLMRCVTGDEVVAVGASGGQALNHLDERHGGEVPDLLDHAYVTVEFARGARGMLELSMFAEASRNEQEISVVGDAGKVEAFPAEGLVRIGRRERGVLRAPVAERTVAQPEGILPGIHHGATHRAHLALARAVRDGREAEVCVEDGLAAVAIGEAAHRAILERRMVAVAVPPAQG
jgi:predicted dehydrogenase